MTSPVVEKLMLISQKIREANWRRSSNSTLSVLQRQSRHDPGLEGSAWVSRVSFPAPKEPDVRKALLDAIDALSDTGHSNLGRPDVTAVEAEWIGSRTCDDADVVSAQDKYAAMMKDIQTPITVLYARGGAF